MEFSNVGEIFTALDNVRKELRQKVANLSDEEASYREHNGGWSVTEIVEHIGLVGGGAVRIVKKLLGRAQNAPTEWNGNFSPPLSFAEQAKAIHGVKLEAPPIVHPQGKQAVTESLAKLDQIREVLEELRPQLGAVNVADAKFPHPFFGDLNSYQWLIIAALHERRHLMQIERILAEKKRSLSN